MDRPESSNVADEVVDAAPVTTEVALIGPLRKIELGLDALRADLAGKTFDLKTVAGDKAARQGRAKCVSLRASADTAYETANKPVLKAQKDARDLRDRIKKEVLEVEEPLNAAIVADEQRRAAERAEAARIEAARVAQHEANIQQIRGYAALAAGRSAAQIFEGIRIVEALSFGPEWEEFEGRGAQARAETVDALRVLLRITTEREEEAAERERQRVEQARVAEEQRSEAKRLADEREKLAMAQAAERIRIKTEADAAEAVRVAAEQKLADDRAEFERQRAEFAEAQAAAVAKAAADAIQTTDVDLPDSPQEETTNVIANNHLDVTSPIVSAEAPTLKLSQIQERIAPLVITAAGLAQLGFPQVPGKGVVYLPSKLPLMVAAMVKHLNALA